ncbi:MAG TPA: tripartite tricarboxylate transporter substrate-binding protein, partial [Thermoanaerobaculia bacterium]|nr:tripartite tricarboxylate transporter substrate-binding protein [Thermoanaerobaculia bacterium]
KAMAGVDIVHVPFKGSAPAVAAVLGGEPKIMVDNIQTALPHIKAGALKPLGLAGDKRSPQLPDLPTLAEQGFPGLSVYSWTAFFVPTGTPQPVIARLNAESLKALKDPLVQKRLEELSTEAIGSTPEELDRFVRKEYETWGELVRALNLKMD